MHLANTTHREFIRSLIGQQVIERFVTRSDSSHGCLTRERITGSRFSLCHQHFQRKNSVYVGCHREGAECDRPIESVSMFTRRQTPPPYPCRLESRSTWPFSSVVMFAMARRPDIRMTILSIPTGDHLHVLGAVTGHVSERRFSGTYCDNRSYSELRRRRHYQANSGWRLAQFRGSGLPHN
jgi:hypothetical protein